MKRERKEKLWYVLNPKYLQEQIDEYGYRFSMENYLFFLAIFMGVIIICGIFFSLSWYLTAGITLLGITLLPGMILDGYKNMYEHKKFLEAADYMEQILYSFKLEGKILTALQDARKLFPVGRMQEAIDSAVSYIEKGIYERDLYQEALFLIERQYPGRRVSAIHNFMRIVENNGGDCNNAVQLLLEDKALWAENVLLLQEDKRKARRRVIMALIITMILAAMFHGVYRSMPEKFSIISNPITQIATACYLVLNILIFRKANRELAGNWLERESISGEKKIQHYWKVIREYKSRGEWKKGILWAAPFLIIAVFCQIRGSVYAMVCMVAAAILMLNQYKIAYRLSYEGIVKEVSLYFPQWLMEMALLLQGNNVQVAIAKTVPEAPVVLRSELKNLVKKLKEQPESIEPYMEFLSEFQLSYVQSAMKMLYAISETGTGDTQEQINVLVRRNGKLLDKSEKILNERNLSGITITGYLPQITISFQMMINMAVFMMVFLTRIGAE